MPTDAKLGLFSGVVGVIIVAVMSANRPPASPQQPASDPSSSSVAVKPTEREKPDPSIAQSSEPTSTPILRTRKEIDGTSTSRGKDDDIDQ